MLFCINRYGQSEYPDRFSNLSSISFSIDVGTATMIVNRAWVMTTGKRANVRACFGTFRAMDQMMSVGGEVLHLPLLQVRVIQRTGNGFISGVVQPGDTSSPFVLPERSVKCRQAIAFKLTSTPMNCMIFHPSLH